MKQLDTTLAAQAKMLGAELYGVTSLDSIQDHVHKIPHYLLDNHSKAISIGMIMPCSLVECLKDGQLFGIKLYNHYFKQVVIPTLERTALIIANLLEKDANKAFILPADLSSFSPGHPVYFHHLIASYAGLGWLGKSNRLINSTYGARVHCITILTDADLEISEAVEDGCKQCCLCLDHCPGGALSGIPFHPHHQPDHRRDGEKCRNTGSTDQNDTTELPVNCGMCLAICPYNK